MTIRPFGTSFMKYKFYRELVEKYYRNKIKTECFILLQNNRWTLVMINA